MHRFQYIAQSPWIGELYIKHFSEVTNGFLVEIGVGDTFQWTDMGGGRRILNMGENFIRGGSNTIEFLELGWSGIYVEPIEEHITNELLPLLKKILTPEQYARVQTVNCAASDNDSIMMLNDIRYLKPPTIEPTNIPYQWAGRRVICRKTEDILVECKVPSIIDLMSIDVEGHELNVLRGINFNIHTQKMIVIEHNIVSLKAIMDLLPKSFRSVQNDNLNAVIINTDYLTI